MKSKKITSTSQIRELRKSFVKKYNNPKYLKFLDPLYHKKEKNISKFLNKTKDEYWKLLYSLISEVLSTRYFKYGKGSQACITRKYSKFLQSQSCIRHLVDIHKVETDWTLENFKKFLLTDNNISSVRHLLKPLAIDDYELALSSEDSSPSESSDSSESLEESSDSEQKAETSDSEDTKSKIDEEVEGNKKVSTEEITEAKKESSKEEQIEEVKESNAKE